MNNYSIWLCFEKNTSKKLDKIKRIVSTNYICPKFKHHLTIFSFSEKEKIKFFENFLRYKSKLLKSFTIETVRCEFKRKFFKSFYIRIRLSKKLKKLNRSFLKFSKKKSEIFDPHVSLFYGNMSSNLKKNLQKKIIIPKKLKVSNILLVINDEKKLEWKIIKKFNLNI